MPPSLDCVRSLAALQQADLRDLAAAVLWLGFAHRLDRPGRPTMNLVELQTTIARQVPELRIRLLRNPPAAAEAREILYEAVQVLEHNRLILWRWAGEDLTSELITLTRRGRAALESEDFESYIR
jgi:hypothetical protein